MGQYFQWGLGMSASTAGLTKKLSLLCLLCFALSSHAHAVTLTATYTGIVTGGIDQAGWFTNGAGVFSGQAFTLTYVYDTNNSQYYGPQPAAPGNAFSDSVTLTISGYSLDGSGPNPNANPFEALSYSATFENRAGYISQYVMSQVGYHATSLEYISTEAYGSNILGSNNYSITSGLLGDGSFQASEGTQGGAFGTFQLETLVVTAVPEPSTWAMMIIGFVWIGGITFRHKRSSTFSVPR
jgi:hypothetical protein